MPGGHTSISLTQSFSLHALLRCCWAACPPGLAASARSRAPWLMSASVSFHFPSFLFFVPQNNPRRLPPGGWWLLGWLQGVCSTVQLLYLTSVLGFKTLTYVWMSLWWHHPLACPPTPLLSTFLIFMQTQSSSPFQTHTHTSHPSLPLPVWPAAFLQGTRF